MQGWDTLAPNRAWVPLGARWRQAVDKREPERPLVYGTAEVARMCGVTVNRLRHWQTMGVVEATGGERHPGTGRMSLWRHDDALVAKVVATLTAEQLATSKIQRAFTALRAARPEVELAATLRSHALVVMRGEHVVCAVSADLADELLPLNGVAVIRPPSVP